jgi:Icc-related predicted phosphoesterase
MRIVAIADTHTCEQELGTVPDGDVLIHAGDMLRRGTAEELIRVSEWLHLLSHPVKIVVAGNDDRLFVNDRNLALRILGMDITYLEDSGVSVDGLEVWGSPWQPESSGAAFSLQRGTALRDKWALIPDSIDVLITHYPPRGIGDRSRIGSIGCDDLRSTVQRVQPPLHVFGHAHADGGFWREGATCFSNVTTWNGRRAATVMDIDPHTRVINEIAVPPSQAAG